MTWTEADAQARLDRSNSDGIPRPPRPLSLNEIKAITQKNFQIQSEQEYNDALIEFARLKSMSVKSLEQVLRSDQLNQAIFAWEWDHSSLD